MSAFDSTLQLVAGRLTTTTLAALVCALWLAAPAANAATEPTIKNLTVAAPEARYAYDSAMMPSLRDPQAHFDIVDEGDCDVLRPAEFRFANEDGVWSDLLRSETQWNIPRTPSPGYKGLYVQLIATCDGVRRPAGNVLYARYTMPNPPKNPTPTAAPATIVNARIDLPNPAYVNDPLRMPTERLPMLALEVSTRDDCTADSFRYAREDGAWVDSVSRTRPIVHLTPGAGERTIYVQLMGTCSETSGPLGSIVKLSAIVPVYPGDPTGPITIDSVRVPATSAASTITVAVRSSNGAGCTQMRMAAEDGNWRNWQPCMTDASFESTRGLGIKGVYVQLKGVDGSLSNIAFAKYRVVASGTSTPAPSPVVDRTAPILYGVLAPSSTTTASAVITINASDDIGVAQVRFANEDGNWGPWQAYGPALTHQLSAGTGYKGVYVQVRDAAHNESAVAFVKLTRR